MRSDRKEDMEMQDKSLKIFYENQAKSIIKKLEKRNMEGFYCGTMEEAKALILKLLGDKKKTVAYGGSMTIDDSDLKQQIVAAGHDLIVRENYKTPEEVRERDAKIITSDVFLMSTNAITLDGELVNIDGRGNRVCFLIYGPQEVYVIAGMNKVAPTLKDAVRRARNVASPANCVRLDCDTPCRKTGFCCDCHDHTICCQFVVTRHSMVRNRIKVILVGETLGY